MSLPFTVGGAQTVIPGVYDTFTVSNSLPAPVPAGRSVLLIGEAEEGVPGNLLDLRLNFFTDFQSVKDFYRAGPIVDSARQIFSNQPSPVFSGAVQRLYVWKTNQSMRASKTVASPTGYGSLVAARYGENGNQIKSQIVTGQAESLPTKTFLYAPSPVSRSYKTAADGVVSASLSVTGDALPSAFVTAMAGATGIATSGGASKTANAASLTVTITASGDNLTLTKDGGGGDFGSNGLPGDLVYIATGLAISGGSDQNAGSYTVVSWSATSIVLKQLKHHVSGGETNAAALFTGSTLAVASGDVQLASPVTMTVSAATAAGAGATMQLLEASDSALGLGQMVRDQDLVGILSQQSAAVGSISAATNATPGQLVVSLTNASWSTVPAVGDVVRIQRGSPIAGGTLKNVGLMAVVAASPQSLTLAHLYTGMTTEAVSSALINGNLTPLMWAPSFVCNSWADRRIDSAAEREVQVLAAQTVDGTSLPTDLIGGANTLEIGYWNASATAAVVSIDANRNLTITPTGGGLNPIVVRLGKYANLKNLVDFLNTQAGVSARLSDRRQSSLPTSVLDAVSSVGCLSANGLNPSWNARIKKDYYDWTQFFINNFSILAFQAGGLVLKAGLPAAEASVGYLSGAVLGATADADVQAGYDAGLKIDARIVLPLISRDASADVADGLTDAGSTYTIAATNAAAKAHASTASSTLFRRERFGYTSFDGSFAAAIQAASELSYERTKMGFQRPTATAGDGTLQKFLPWMEMAAIAAGRVQSALGTSMLHKPFNISKVEHVGPLSLYTDTLVQDFDPEDEGDLSEAISAGLVVMRAVAGFGVRMESPDLTTRSRVNDPQGWVWERENVLFTCDEVRQTIRSVLDNYIGPRTTDVPTAIIEEAVKNVLRSYIGGALVTGSVTKIVKSGNTITAQVKITPAEAIEAIILDVVAERATAA